jgi:shikimate kinase
MTRNAWVVWLDGDPEVLRERMKKEQQAGNIRPSITGTDPLIEIRRVLADRNPIYDRISALRVDTTSLAPEEAAALIGNALENLTKESRHAR